MALSEIFGALRNRRQQRELSTWQQYRALVAALADNEEIDADEAADLLETVGKTEKQLADDIELFNRRKQWEQQVKDGEGCHEKASHEEQEIKRLEAELLAIQQKYAAKMQGHRERSNGYQVKFQSALQAADNLRQTSANPWLDEQLKDINSRLRELGNRERELLELVSSKDIHFEWNLSRSDSYKAKNAWSKQPDHWEAMAKRLGEELEAAKSEIADIRAERADLLSQSATIRDEQLEA